MLWNDYVGNRHINLKNNDMMPFILQVLIIKIWLFFVDTLFSF